ncbi:MAG TPA: hypothetical protein VHX16_18140 [Chloroflexota bacterium]|jgi:predicted metal-dependent enzyme (double-stranded beta helix superfamily)|nr:hypothetical protein [Chloroflexota bacterium]
MTQTIPTAYGLDELIDDTRSSILSGRNIPETVGGVRRGLKRYLDNRELRDDICDRIAANGYRGITMYKDPDLDFVITAGKGDPGVQRPAHDHSDCWAVYGVYDGAIRFRRYKLLTPIERNTWEGPAELESIAEWVAGAGRIDGILPGGIHDLRTEDESISVIIRCHDLKTIWRNFYDLEHGTFKRVRGGV